MAKILYGSEVVEAMSAQASKDILMLEENSITPCLAILRIGNRPDDISYEKTATKRCEKLRIAVKHICLDSNVETDEVLQNIEKLNSDDKVHGVLMFRPMPVHIDEQACCLALDPSKDVDAATPASMAGVFMNAPTGYKPCTAQACIEILNHFNIDIRGKKAVVIGRSLVVGKPVAMLLLAENATVTICHTKTQDIESVVREADIVIVASGQMESVGATYLREGQVVIDVGIAWNDEKQKLCGDVIFEEAQDVCAALTPVPGGVGTVTTSVLLSHVIESAKQMLEHTGAI